MYIIEVSLWDSHVVQYVAKKEIQGVSNRTTNDKDKAYKFNTMQEVEEYTKALTEQYGSVIQKSILKVKPVELKE
jgi:hypothetical protein